MNDRTPNAVADGITATAGNCLKCLTVLLLVLAAGITRGTAADASEPEVQALQPSDGNLELDDIIWLQIRNLNAWRAADPNHKVTKLVPYLNGRGLRGNYPQEINGERVCFHLQITAESREAWTDLVGAPTAPKKPVTLSVGLENDDAPFASLNEGDRKVLLTIVSPAYGALAGTLIAMSFAVLIWLARTTNLLRESGPNPVGGKRKPYSLGRVQMAFWFFLTYASYLVIWLVTDNLDTITSGLLGLMGISSGTALGEAMIDTGKDAASAGKLQEQLAEKQALEQTVPLLRSQLADLSAKTTPSPEDTATRASLNQNLQDRTARLNLVNQQIASLSGAASDRESAGFLQDCISDGSGASLHRFQIFVWTIVLGIMFLSSVYNSLHMPEFSATLLGLMGISSGTYIGFKFPEPR